ncbi:MAG: nitroreductase family deazaflavin-dependent oxidoreductase [Ilumatobacteraceae bacterium]
MSLNDEIIDSPTGWVADHIRRYVATNGEDGHIWRGVPCLLLTTTGHKSGVQRRTALIYGRLDDDYVIVASKGGYPTHPLWYINILSTPEVTLQVAADVFQATATTIPEGVDYDRAWQVMVGIWPDFAVYQTKTTRRIPLVRLRAVPRQSRVVRRQ